SVLGGPMLVPAVSGVLPASGAVAGLSPPGLLARVAVYVVACGWQQAGAIQVRASHGFGRTRSVPVGQLRVMAPVMFMSAFMNNTPIVATFVPAVLDWTRKCRMSASKFLIPLSYAAILGGTCTLIGTSTNLVVNGMLLETGERGFAFFELAWLGIPSAVIGLAYVLVFTRRLLPERVPAVTRFEDPREYTVEMQVA